MFSRARIAAIAVVACSPTGQAAPQAPLQASTARAEPVVERLPRVSVVDGDLALQLPLDEAHTCVFIPESSPPSDACAGLDRDGMVDAARKMEVKETYIFGAVVREKAIFAIFVSRLAAALGELTSRARMEARLRERMAAEPNIKVRSEIVL